MKETNATIQQNGDEGARETVWHQVSKSSCSLLLVDSDGSVESFGLKKRRLYSAQTKKRNSVTILFNKCTSQPAHRAHRGNIITWSAPLTRGANTLSSGRDQGGRRSKTVAAASARALKPVGVDRGRRRSRLAPLGLSPSLAGQGFRAYGCERQVHG